MMNAIPFDTLQFAKRLKAVGFTDDQAAVITEIQREASNETLQQAIHDYHLDGVATKRDLKELEAELKRDLKQMEIALEHKIELLRSDAGRLIAESRADLTRWIIGAGFLQTALIVGVLLKIAHLI